MWPSINTEFNVLKRSHSQLNINHLFSSHIVLIIYSLAISWSMVSSSQGSTQISDAFRKLNSLCSLADSTDIYCSNRRFKVTLNHVLSGSSHNSTSQEQSVISFLFLPTCFWKILDLSGSCLGLRGPNHTSTERDQSHVHGGWEDYLWCTMFVFCKAIALWRVDQI